MNYKDEMSSTAGASTRDAITTATVNLLLIHPSDRLSMEAIAKAAGVSRRTVFNHFETKEALFEEALKGVWRVIGITQITEAGDAFDDPVRTLRKIGNAITDFWLGHNSIAIARMVIREAAQFPELTEHYIELGKRPVTRTIIEFLQQLHETGVAQIADADLAARQFIGLINEPLVFLQILGAKETHSREHSAYVVDEAVRMFLLRYPFKK